MKKESSEEAVRNQYVSENEYLKSSINRASLSRSGRPQRGMKGSRSHEKQENNKVDGSGDGGTGSVMDYIRKYENGDNDSSSDDDDDVDVDDSNDDDDDSNHDDSNDDDSDSDGLEELELQVGDSIDNSVREDIINNRKKMKVTYEDNRNGDIINIENSVEKETDEIREEEIEEEGKEIDGVENTPLSTGPSPYKSILEEFEEMENENMNSKEIRNILIFSTTEIEDEDDIGVEVESSHLEKSITTPRGDFEYNENVDEKDEDEDDDEINEKINLEQIFPEIKNDLNNEVSSNSDEDSDDYLLLHRNNVDDVLQNLLNDFKINIKAKTSNKKTNKNINKSELKNTKEKKKSTPKKKLTLKKEIDISHSSRSNELDKKKSEKSQKNFSFDKKKSSTQIIFHDQEKKESSINHFNSIFSHKKTILCFTLAITIHYFIFSGISKLV